MIPSCKRTIKIGGEDVVLDNENLRFNETNVNKFMEDLAILYDYYGEKLALAEAILTKHEEVAEVAHCEAFEAAKGEGNSDKLADSRAKQNPNVLAANATVISSKLKVTQLKQHLKAWDKAHENLQSRGHMLRKEMDKLNLDIRHGLEADVDRVIRGG